MQQRHGVTTVDLTTIVCLGAQKLRQQHFVHPGSRGGSVIDGPGVRHPRVPIVQGTGTAGVKIAVTCGELIWLHLTNARTLTQAAFIIGFDTWYAPFKGGTMVPSIDFMYFLPTGPTGSLYLATPWIEGVPPGASTYFQYFIRDPHGRNGFSASNALRATTP